MLVNIHGLFYILQTLSYLILSFTQPNEVDREALIPSFWHVAKGAMRG